MATIISGIFIFLVFVFSAAKIFRININLDASDFFSKKDSAVKVLEMQNLHDEVINNKGSIAAKQMLFNRLFGFRPEKNELDYLVEKDNVNMLSRMKQARSVLEFDETGPEYKLKARFSGGLLFYYWLSDGFFWLLSGMLVGFLLVFAFAIYINNTIFIYSILALIIEMVVGLILFIPVRRDWESAIEVIEKYLPRIAQHNKWVGAFRRHVLSASGGVLVAVGIFLAFLITYDIENNSDITRIIPATQTKIIRNNKSALPIIQREGQRYLAAPVLRKGPTPPAYQIIMPPTRAVLSTAHNKTTAVGR